MLFLLFHTGNDRYVIDASRVIEILPMVSLQRLPQALPGLAGILNYRGVPVPTLDLCQITMGTPARERLSTRIIIIKLSGLDASERIFGLIAERVTQTLRKDPSEFRTHGANAPSSLYLGPILIDSEGVIQWIQERRLLAEKVQELLFGEHLATP
jgi:chemotaxis-related protein WspB